MELNKQVLQIFLSLSLVLIKAQEQRDYYIDFTRTSASHNSSIHIKELSCWLRPLVLENCTRQVQDCNLRFAKSVKTFDVRAIANAYPRKMRPWTVLRVQLNGCNAFQIIHRQKIIRIFTKTFLKYFNVKDIGCPLKKDFNYTLRGFKYDASEFPSYVPEGEYEGILQFIMDNKMVGTMSLSGFVKYYRKNKKG